MNVESWVKADGLYSEVVDEIEILNGRLDSSGVCLELLEAYLADPSEANRQRLAEAYNTIPVHRRMYVLGDQDAKDWPLRVVITPVGKKLAGKVVTDERRRQALEYFADRAVSRKASAERTPPVAAAVVVPGSFHHNGWPDPPGILALHTQYPAPVRIGRVTYPTVEHAYWALRTTDPGVRQAVLAESNPYGLSRLAGEAAARDGCDASLQATIIQLLRVKFQQHESLTQELLATGEGRIVFNATGFGDYYAYNSCRHLIGRLLELVRAEQQAWRSGLLDLGTLE
ncbi:MAG: NADAR family protein [Kineosporiaceae bacterium]